MLSKYTVKKNPDMFLAWNWIEPDGFGFISKNISIYMMNNFRIFAYSVEPDIFGLFSNYKSNDSKSPT